MSNKVLITNEQNAVKIPSGLRILIRRSCNAVLDFEKFDGPAEISHVCGQPPDPGTQQTVPR